jgi:DnaK suppressor protein
MKKPKPARPAQGPKKAPPPPPPPPPAPRPPPPQTAGRGPAGAPPPRSRPSPPKMSRADLERYRKMLLERKRALAGDVMKLEEEALRTTGQEASGDLSSMPIHMADLASDNYEQEFNLGLMESGQGILQEIDEALERIAEGTFGLCESCEKLIGRSRLDAVPFARLCIACKTREEAVEG